MKTYKQKGNTALLILNQKTSAKVLVNNVVLIKGDVNYTTFYLNGGQERVVAHTMKFFVNHLENFGFLRVHRAFMINPSYVKEYNPTEESVMMSNGQKANISRRKKHILKKILI
ncbi:LytTR family DNA-binding domain-containing protein [Arcicella sp. LKC2W]|uniref:LytR/AlgR family response regulator transcription factor n=1 Tax=Arcicella sp. LKC2W TaxID=2984198 RepID=UPI002B21346D|nr:LytTR family DNA-binding domain-containing protein [Arcicella sp. LKC2W]MEA5460034.1 LytTR family DNA-binding domain-containing protein [Arcicella sp. LKC2W]